MWRKIFSPSGVAAAIARIRRVAFSNTCYSFATNKSAEQFDA
jgi:hypothetical protein